MFPIPIKGIISIKSALRHSAEVTTVPQVIHSTHTHTPDLLVILYRYFFTETDLRIFFSPRIIMNYFFIFPDSFFHANQNKISIKFPFYSQIPKKLPLNLHLTRCITRRREKRRRARKRGSWK